MSLRTPLGKVLGLGSAGEGTGHWWVQRVTAVALVERLRVRPVQPLHPAGDVRVRRLDDHVHVRGHLAVDE